MYIAYIIQSESDNLYTGHTNDLKRRLFEHNNGLCKTTKVSKNWEFIYTKTFPTRSEAMRHEKWLKNGHGREFIKSYMNSNKKA